MPKRVRKSVEVEGDAEQKDTSKSVLGGLSGGYRVSGEERDSSESATKVVQIPYEDKHIICHRLGQANETSKSPPALIFTHGAGGGIENPATHIFAQGFAIHSQILVFQGTMNLKSRVKSFKTVIEHEKLGSALGGRSMGARAAVIAAQDEKLTKAVVLSSYPLTSKKDVRDQILLDLRKDVDVLFISGDKDEMCDIKHLNQVRKKMKAPSWLIVVHGADHSMTMKPKSTVEEMRRCTGSITAEWLKTRDAKQSERSIRWDEEKKELDQGKWTKAVSDKSSSTPKKRKRDS